MATTFEKIMQNAQAKGVTAQKQSIDWFRSNIRKTALDPSKLIREEQNNLINSWTNVGPGQMYFAFYDPKHKDTLPYYDLFPLILPIERYKDGILSINLHYLPPVLRAKVLNELFDTATNDRFDAKTKMKLSYGVLKQMSKFDLFKPCIKRYLGNHFRSRFIRISPENWISAVFLPVESFEKKSKKFVWEQARK